MRLFLRSLLFTFFAITLTSVNVFSQSATITTDQADYPPGSTVIITGTGFQAGETVTLQVIHVGETGDNATSGAHAPFTAIADASGNVSSTWIVPLDEDELGATLLLTAVGGSSGLKAEWTFTDATNTNTSIISAYNPTFYGQNATFTASVTQQGNNNIIKTGSVDFYDITNSNSPIKLTGTPVVLDNNGIATFSISNLSASSHRIQAFYNGTLTNNGNFENRQSNADLLQTINKATPSISVSGTQTFTYNGNPQGPSTITYNGDGTTSLLYVSTDAGNYLSSTAPINAGNYQVIARATPGTNYNSVNSAGYPFTIGQADPSISVSGTQTFTYNANPQGPSTISYNGDGSTSILYTNVGGTAYSSATAPTNAGNYQVVASATAGKNYKAKSSAAYSFTIGQADPAISVTGAQTFTYNGSAQGPSTITYNGDGTISLLYTNVGGATYSSATAPINAGNYQVVASATVGTNYKAASSAAYSFTIGQADPAISVTGAQTFTYNGTSQGPSTINYNGDGTTSLLYTNVGGTTYSSATGPRNAGNYQVVASATAGANYKAGSSAAYTFTIQRRTLNITATGISKVYDGNTTATVNLSDDRISGDDLTLHYGTATFNDKNAGTGKTVSVATIYFTGADAINYLGNTMASATANITKANANIVLTPYNVPYDGKTHTATFTATGVETTPADLSSLIDVTKTIHTDAGDYATDSWSFAGNNNYNAVSATTIEDRIAKVNANITVTPYSVPYDGKTHTATFTATGVETTPADLSSLMDVTKTIHTDAGDYATDSWSFAGNNNYNAVSATTIEDKIAKVNANITVTPYSVPYDGKTHTATFTAVGVETTPADLTSLMTVSGTTHTNAGDYPADGWSFTGNGNYNTASGTVHDVINKANPVITVTPYTTVIYDGKPHTATFTAVGVETTPVDLTSLMNVSGTTHTNAGDYPSDGWSFTGNGNYNTASGTVHDVINKANPVITVTPYTTVIYEGNAHTATFTAVGVETTPVDLTSLMNVSGTTHTNAGDYPADAWSFTGNGNYNTASGTVHDVINKANPVITVTPYTTVIYDGNAHTATFTAVGVETTPVDLTSLMNVSGTTHTNAGDYPSDGWSFTGNGNYNTASGTVHDVIGQRPITITPDPAQFKYCGQPDPTFNYTGSEPLIAGNSYSGALARLGTNDVGTYPYTLGTFSAGSNYTLTLGGSNTFEIRSVSIDASATSTAIQSGTPTKLLTATVSGSNGPVNAASVTFTVTNFINGGITNVANTPVTVTTVNGVATYPLNSALLPLGLYSVTAVAGNGCSQSVAYFSVYDPTAGFVTGGGWITSPVGAYSADPTLTGKANFGFNAQYKKGNNVPDGNTEFQFQAGNLNFKSTSYGTGSLVIAGAKAIFQGTGTINGTGSYNFMISAIDGSISGGGGVDKFRIKIQTAGGGVVYDNNVNASNNADPTTVLGGGSIVIHSTSNTKSRLMDTVSTKSNVSISNNQNSIGANDLEGNGKLSITVMPNPTSYYFTFIMKSLSKENVKLTVTDITGRVVEQRSSVAANSTLQLGSGYHPGIYIAEFIQGNNRINLRLIKEGK
jgi:hypothetical protein